MPTLIDTNILVYASGVDQDPGRQWRAIQALESHRFEGALAVQVLAEFASVLIRKGRTAQTIRDDVTTFVKTWRIIAPDDETVPLAMAAVIDYRMSFWDAMLWAIALQNGFTTILSADGPTGSTIGGVKYKSPF